MNDDARLAYRMRRQRRRVRVIALVMALALIVPIVASTISAID